MQKLILLLRTLLYPYLKFMEVLDIIGGLVYRMHKNININYLLILKLIIWHKKSFLYTLPKVINKE